MLPSNLLNVTLAGDAYLTLLPVAIDKVLTSHFNETPPGLH